MSFSKAISFVLFVHLLALSASLQESAQDNNDSAQDNNNRDSAQDDSRSLPEDPPVRSSTSLESQQRDDPTANSNSGEHAAFKDRLRSTSASSSSEAPSPRNGAVVPDDVTSNEDDNFVSRRKIPASSAVDRELAQKPSVVSRYNNAKFRNAVRKTQRDQQQPPAKHIVTPRERENFETSMVETHNAYRRRHCAGPLKRSQSLSESAQAWANELAARNYLFPNPHNREGQNCIWLKYKDGQLPTGALISKLWYDEIDLYDYRNPTISLDVGHFTQLVWKSAREIGIGMAQADDGKWYFVANYSPVGNRKSELAQNVLRATCS